jgi:hypothetical protein
VLSSFVALSVLGCSRSLSRSDALSKFKLTQAYGVLRNGIQPDGSIVNMAHNQDGSPSVGSNGLVRADGETLADIAVTGIVQSDVHAIAHFRLAFRLSASAQERIRAQQQQYGIPSMGNNDVCHVDDRNSQVL